jgi:hypothetical protein
MSEHKYNVYVAPTAGDKMYAHIRFLGQANVSAAERLYKSLCLAIDELEDNPCGYPVYTPQIPMNKGALLTECGLICGGLCSTELCTPNGVQKLRSYGTVVKRFGFFILTSILKYCRQLLLIKRY